VLFQEGTRCSDGVLHPFKKGPFVIAIEGGVPIVPVGLVESRPIMPKGSFRIRPGTIVVRVGAPISVADMRHSDRDELRDTVRDAVVRLRGGEGRTCCLPGEPPLDDVPERSRSSTNTHESQELTVPPSAQRVSQKRSD
jgi:1-acyl-sn-glycerol-3-phosphate acyltransferase